jgi:hypothetical protein
MVKKIDVYLDQLNFLSLIKILININITNINRIFYLDKNYTLGLLFFFKKKRFVDCTKFEESRILVEGKFFNLYLWDTLTDISNKFLSEKKLLAGNIFFKENTNNVKFEEFLRENFIFETYIPIKLYIFSKKFSKEKNVFFFVKKNPFNLILNLFNENFNYYRNFFFYISKKKNKKNIYYNFIYVRYFSSFLHLFRIIFHFLKICIKGIVSPKCKYNKRKIAIDLLQREIDLNSITDFYWLKYSKIDKQNICAISHVKWDKISRNTLSEIKINDIFYSDLPIFFKDFIKIIFLLPKIFFYIFFTKKFDGWLKFYEHLYLAKKIYYQSVYKMQNIKIYFSMLDVDDDKFIKAEALEFNEALFIQSHWSNFPIFRKYNQKCCDILFAWSPHFIKNNFSYYPFKKIYSLGYPNDHYFEKIRAEKIKTQFDQSKFIISYMDNLFYNDIYYGKTASKRIMKMFINLLNKYHNLILFLKPKSKSGFEISKEIIPEIDYLIEIKKIKVFFGDKVNEKYSPARIAQISNLVVGMGVSSAAAESSFFGTTSFHYDNLNLINQNEFCKKSLNKVVFNSLDNLETAITEQIINSKMSIIENKRYHATLDFYQDGNTGIRTALIMDLIFEKYVSLKKINNLLTQIDELINSNKDLFKKKIFEY